MLAPAYVKQCLVPTLKRGETVLMDNLPVHKVAGVAEAIEAEGATPICSEVCRRTSTRSSSPAANSSGRHLRKAAEHTIPRLLRRIGRVVTDFSPQECRNLFPPCGLRSNRPGSADDRVLLFFLLHEQPYHYRERTLSEAMRVVKPGGKIVAVDYAMPHLVPREA